jgi:hypothetical protein
MGKTSTAAVLVRALVRGLKQGFIVLVCASSNAACDEMLLRFLALDPGSRPVRVGNHAGGVFNSLHSTT